MQQRRLARAVAADEPDRLARLDRRARRRGAPRPRVASARPRATKRSLSVRCGCVETRNRCETRSTTIRPGSRLTAVEGTRLRETPARRTTSVPAGHDARARTGGTAGGVRRSAARVDELARPSTSGSVRREHAVAEVEDVARPPAGAARARRAPPSRPAPTGRAAPRGRGSPARRGLADRAQPSSSGIRQSSPITSPPAAAIAGSSVAVPVPKWIVGTPRRAARRTRADHGATNSA